MRILSILILALVVAHPDQVSGKKKAPKKGGPCGKTFIKQLNGKCYYMGLKKVSIKSLPYYIARDSGSLS